MTTKPINLEHARRVATLIFAAAPAETAQEVASTILDLVAEVERLRGERNDGLGLLLNEVHEVIRCWAPTAISRDILPRIAAAIDGKETT
jgi:hypothetical protein